jgi:hypothetical protein
VIFPLKMARPTLLEHATLCVKANTAVTAETDVGVCDSLAFTELSGKLAPGFKVALQRTPICCDGGLCRWKFSKKNNLRPQRLEDSCALALQTPHFPPSFAQCLQYLQFLQALHGSAPVQVAPKSSRDPANRLNVRIRHPIVTTCVFRFVIRNPLKGQEQKTFGRRLVHLIPVAWRDSSAALMNAEVCRDTITVSILKENPCPHFGPSVSFYYPSQRSVTHALKNSLLR